MSKLKPFLIVPALLLMTACAPMKSTRGNLVDDYRLSEVIPGVSTQSDVIHVMGSPTTTDPFDPNIWYYLGQRTEKVGIFDPKVTEEKIIRLTFNAETGVVQQIAPVQNTRNDIPINSKKTPTAGNEMTVVQQMLGNLGKFNKDQNVSPTTIGQ